MRLASAALVSAGLVLAAHMQAFAQSCPAAADVAQAHVVGEWKAQVEGATPFIITLARHPEFAETLRGFFERDGKRIVVAGDVDDGDFTLEESEDGVRITAVWLGDVVEGSCGREIRGTWKKEGAPLERPFILRKQP
jgi:hypothetical protein